MGRKHQTRDSKIVTMSKDRHSLDASHSEPFQCEPRAVCTFDRRAPSEHQFLIIHFHETQSWELKPIKMDVTQLVKQDSYSEKINKVAGRTLSWISVVPPTRSNYFKVCVINVQVRRLIVDCGAVKRQASLSMKARLTCSQGWLCHTSCIREAAIPVSWAAPW